MRAPRNSRQVCKRRRLGSPESDAFVLQSTNVAPDELATLGEDLTLAEGWQFRTRALDQDLTVPLDGKVKIAVDDLGNVYNLPTA